MSFDRPYAQYCQDHLVDRPSSVGSSEFLLWEFPLSYWIEQQGYDVSYISGVDTHTDGPGLQRARGFISVGHDEYWTREMYDNVSAARDAGVNLAFLSGNSVWGVVPLLPSAEGQPQRIMRREGKFLGEELSDQLEEARGVELEYPAGPDGGLLMGGRTAGIGGGDWTCTNPGHWLYEETGMQEGETIEGLVGWEMAWIAGAQSAWIGSFWPRAPCCRRIGDTVLMRQRSTTVPETTSSLTPEPSGGRKACHRLPVTCRLHIGMPSRKVPDPRVQRMMANVFDRFIS